MIRIASELVLILPAFFLIQVANCQGVSTQNEMNQSGSAHSESVTSPSAQLGQWSISRLESRISEIDKKLERLCPISLRSGVGAVGGRSALGSESRRCERFRLNLREQVPIDQIVLVPTIWRDSKSGLCADGFPLEFSVIVGSKESPSGKVIARYTEADGLLPRIAPLVIQCNGVEGSWIRIEATKLSARLWDSQCAFQLSEILAFSGHENVALHCRLKGSSPNSFQSKYLVDGFVPYLMHSDIGEKSVAFVKQGGILEPPELMFDLGETLPLNRIHLHGVDLSDTIPQSHKDGFGMPRRLLVEGANEPDFSDAFSLVEMKLSSVYEYGPIVMRRFAEASCRYVRLTAIKPNTLLRGQNVIARIGFAEIELFSRGKNVAIGSPVRANFPATDPHRRLSAMAEIFMARSCRFAIGSISYRNDMTLKPNALLLWGIAI